MNPTERAWRRLTWRFRKRPNPCLYADDPRHEDVCYMCAPFTTRFRWEMGYRWNRVLWFVSRHLDRPVLGRDGRPQRGVEDEGVGT